jgi:hypothetical protein
MLLARTFLGVEGGPFALNGAPPNHGYDEPSSPGRPRFGFGRQRMASRDDIRREMRSNAKALEAERSELVRVHPNAFVLMRGGKVRGIYPSLEEAEAAGLKQFPNRLFSLHELSTRPRRVGGLARA